MGLAVGPRSDWPSVERDKSSSLWLLWLLETKGNLGVREGSRENRSALVRLLVSAIVGVLVGVPVGILADASVGVLIGAIVGALICTLVGVLVSILLDVFVGILVGISVGALVGILVGVVVGAVVGVPVGVPVGVFVGGPSSGRGSSLDLLFLEQKREMNSIPKTPGEGSETYFPSTFAIDRLPPYGVTFPSNVFAQLEV